MCLCICACMRVSACVCAPICVCACVCVFTCVYIYVCVCVLSEGGGGGGLRGQLCVCPICHPTLLTPKGMAERVGGFILEKGIGVQRSNGQQCRFLLTGRRQRTPAGCVEANLPIYLTKQWATPVKICLSLPNKAHTPLKLCLR